MHTRAKTSSGAGQRALVALLLCVVAAACRAPGRSDAGGTAQQGRRLLQVETRVHAATVVAGTPVVVRCVVRERGVLRDDVAVQVRAPANVEVVRRDSVESVFLPVHAGRAVFACDAGALGGDPRGAAVEVTPAAAARVAVRQGAPTAVAGEPLALACVVEDAFGNVCGEAGAPAVPAELAVAAGQVCGTRAGQYAVRCAAAGLPPAATMLEVVPGPLHHVTPVPSPAAPHAGEDVAVACVAADALGNPIADAGGRLEVEAPPQTVGAGLAAWERTAHGMMARQAGVYTLRCASAAPAPTVTALTVRPGLAHSWSVDWHQIAGECQVQNVPLAPSHAVFDRFGNPVEDAVLRLRAVPEYGVTQAANGGLVFAREGDYDVYASVTPQAADAPTVLPAARMRVDSTPPEVEIAYPARGSMIVGGDFGEGTQRIVGTLRDPSGLMAASIDGRPVEGLVPGMRELHFEVLRPSRWGMNTIEVSTTDGCGVVGRYVQAYLRSPSYGPPVTGADDAAAIPHALSARLDQRLFDSGTPGAPDDVAGLLEMALDSERLSALLPEYLVAGPGPSGGPDHGLPLTHYHCGWGRSEHKPTGYEVTRDGPVTIKRPQVTSLRAVDGGWRLSIAVDAIRVPVRLHTYVDWWCMGGGEDQMPAVMEAHALSVDIAVEVAQGDGRPQLRICDTCMQTHFQPNEPRLDVDWGQARTLGMQGLVKPTVEVLIAAFRRRVQGALQEQLRRDVLASMQKFVGSWRLTHSVELPPPLGGGVVVGSTIDGLDFAGPEGGGHGHFGLAAQFYPLRPPQVAPRAGPIRGPAASTHLTTLPQETFAMGVRDDLLNGLLWSLWAGGSFDVPAVEDVLVAYDQNFAASVGDSTMRLTAGLPPVVMPSPRAGHVIIGMGELYVHTRMFTEATFGGHTPAAGAVPVEIGVYASALVEAELALDDQQRLVVLPASMAEPKIYVAHTSSPQLQVTGSDQVERWLKHGLPAILSHALGALPLPALQVSEVPGVPPGTRWEVSAAQLRRPALATTTTLAGTLRVRHAAPGE